MIAAYGWEGMSTDESDHNNGSSGPKYLALTKKWRNPNATMCLRTLDALHRDSHFKSAPAPKLPSGLYDPEWLSRQPDVVKEDLQITENFEYDFSHTAAIVNILRVNHGKIDLVHPYV
ncbi:hypothetical protein EST38_g14202 [Candolleomyces aberdarensis]|uniref:Uncharacterized protein n=1 Tax=Candolleomyces aberdarensis TaxID=2316362 RepID=A0A4Q2CY06_9AGAR|nr:hypothetical protein EST38_g14202 [Candolleomyces aberdarensis]